MKQPTLLTRRLKLRPFLKTDANDVQRLAGNKNVSKTTLTIPYPYENGMAESWIITVKTQWLDSIGVVFAVIDQTSDNLIGVVSIGDINNGIGALGYWIGEEHWGQGFATEASLELLEFVFKNFNVKKIKATHLSINIASGKVMKKLGMHDIGNKQKNNRSGNAVQIELYEIYKNII